MIPGIFDQQTDAIINIKLGNADADSYRVEPLEALLDR